MVTTPATEASSLCSIFMASMVTRSWPSSTESPDVGFDSDDRSGHRGADVRVGCAGRAGQAAAVLGKLLLARWEVESEDRGIGVATQVASCRSRQGRRRCGGANRRIRQLDDSLEAVAVEHADGASSRCRPIRQPRASVQAEPVRAGSRDAAAATSTSASGCSKWMPARNRSISDGVQAAGAHIRIGDELLQEFAVGAHTEHDGFGERRIQSARAPRRESAPDAMIFASMGS